MGIEFPTLVPSEIEELNLRAPDAMPTTYILRPDNTVAATLVGLQSRGRILEELSGLGVHASYQLASPATASSHLSRVPAERLSRYRGLGEHGLCFVDRHRRRASRQGGAGGFLTEIVGLALSQLVPDKAGFLCAHLGLFVIRKAALSVMTLVKSSVCIRRFSDAFIYSCQWISGAETAAGYLGSVKRNRTAGKNAPPLRRLYPQPSRRSLSQHSP